MSTQVEALARSGTNEPALAPEAEERLLHCVFRERLVTQDAVREPVGEAADPVVELPERRIVRACDERNQGLV